MQRNVNIRDNNRIFEELGLSGLASILSSLPTKKAISKGGGSGTKGKSSGNNARQGEGSDLSDYIPEIEEPDDGDDDTDLEEEATPLANEVYFLSWLRGQDYIFSMPIEADYCVEYISAIHNTTSELFI